MAVNRQGPFFAPGLNNAVVQVPPQPIAARRAPTAADVAQIGTLWLDMVAQVAYILVAPNVWASSPAGGATVVASLQVTGLGGIVVDTGDVDITLGALNVPVGAVTFGGNLTVGGTTTLNGTVNITGDFNLIDPAEILIESNSNAAGALTLKVDGGTSETLVIESIQGTGGDSITISSSAGGIFQSAAGLITIESSRNNAQAVLVEATAGGIDILASGAAAGEDIDIVATGSSVNISSSEAIANSVTVVSSAGGIDVTAAGGAGLDIDIVNTAGSVNVSSGEVIANSMVLTSAGGLDITVAGTGGLDVDLVNTAGAVNVQSGQAAADAIVLNASNAAGGIVVNCGTAGIAVDSTGAFSIDGAAASNVTTTGAGIDLTLSSVLGSVLVSSTEDAALAIRLHANGGTSETIQLHSDQGTGVGSINLLSDVGGLTFRATGLASADAINLEAAAGGIDVDAALQINIASSQNAADAVRILASAGGIDVDAVGAAGEDIVITNTGGSVSVVATEAAADAIVLNSSNAAGGIDLLTGGGEISISSAGNVTMVAATDTQASPSATAVINAHVGAATFTGFTTASAGAQVFTITNSVVSATSQILVSAANEGANDAQMTVTRVLRGAGTFDVTLTNNGAAALNGDVTITFWVLN